MVKVYLVQWGEEPISDNNIQGEIVIEASCSSRAIERAFAINAAGKIHMGKDIAYMRVSEIESIA